MKVIVTGTRGIPNIQGGVERHCEELYPLLMQSPDMEITIMRRSSYITKENNNKYFKGIYIKTLFSPKNIYAEAIIHSLLSLFYAVFKHPDILHIHAIGPNLLTPLARILGLKVIMTHHGPDYERQKWGPFAKKMLRMGERVGVKYANKVIVISDWIGTYIAQKYGREDYKIIPNGVPKAIIENKTDYLFDLGITPHQYIFTLGRFVPEKGFECLIKAWKFSNINEKYRLVIAGYADHETEYSQNFKELAKKEGVLLTGSIKGEKLCQLFSHARLFVIPSYYEGLPIALLEAMSYGIDILASDITANKEVNLPEDFYFETGNIGVLANRLNQKLTNTHSVVPYDTSKYSWEKIAKQTYEIYKEVLEE